MTREEAINQLTDAKAGYEDYLTDEAIDMAIEALSVEPCDCISFPKGTLKKRGKGYVVYDVEWLKENWQTELMVMGIECEDAISRQAVHNLMAKLLSDYLNDEDREKIENTDAQIADLPSVTPKVSECEDCISRAELLKAIDTWDRFGVDDTNSLFRLDNLSLPHYVPYIHFDDVVKCIKGMPSVTPKQKMGHWVKISPAGIYECSECGQNVMTGDIDAYRHCHGCGAKMSENPTGSESEDT